MLGPCTACKKEMRPARMKEHEAPGTVGYGADGKCRSCRRRSGEKKTIPTNCVECEVPMRPRGTSAAKMPGTREHAGKGVCNTCKARGRIRAPKPAPVVEPEQDELEGPADPEAVASLDAWTRRRRERIRQQQRIQAIRVEQEARRREFIARRQAA